MILWYSSTLFISALLLFLVQPMVGKMVLPLYGGTSSVWNTCMVFFQTMLLLGYGYAHFSIRWLTLRRQAMLHIFLLIAAAVILPLSITRGTIPPVSANPVLWLSYKLFIAVGIPFCILSSSAPLLQRWFSGLSHAASADPYFLYAASNAGSLAGLLGYPIILERLWDLTDQTRLWNLGYGSLVLMVLICGFFLLRRYYSGNGGAKQADVHLHSSTPEQPTGRLKLFWIFLSFVPSSLMLSVTAFITNNIAAVPLIWVVPLTLYLTTFILVFARRQLLPHLLMVRIMPFIVICAAPFFYFSIRGSGHLLIMVHLIVFFVTAMVCHGELVKRRPSSEHLTGFYLYMAVGGVLGGLFNALIAPAISTRIVEYPLVMFLACFIIPQLRAARDVRRQRRLDLIFPLAIGCLNATIIIVAYALDLKPSLTLFSFLFAPAALACFASKERPVRFALSFGLILCSLACLDTLNIGRELHISRNFFGVKRITLAREGDMRMLIHGSTIHGMQFIDPSRQEEILSYYHPSGPIGDVFDIFNHEDFNSNVGVIGLGIGSIAGYSRAGQHFVFYEIDPDVERIARDNNYFHFLANCKGSCNVILGDGRLTIAVAPDHYYGMIIIDAFSSDSIPVHLLTKEALALYLSKLQARGLLVFHISNSYLNLEPVLSNQAKEFGLKCLVRNDKNEEQTGRHRGKCASDYVVIGIINPEAEKSLLANGWRRAENGQITSLWTDRYSNILNILKR